MSQLLFVSGHPNFGRSVANKAIWQQLQQQFPQAEFLRLDEKYGDFNIDVAAEQARVQQADVIVLQFPLYLFGVPALMKKWLEDVFVNGFAHGSEHKVKGKKLIASFTFGAPEEVYQHDALLHHTVEEILSPLQSFASLCAMDWAGDVHSGSVSSATQDPEKLQRVQQKAQDHAERLAQLLNAI